MSGNAKWIKLTKDNNGKRVIQIFPYPNALDKIESILYEDCEWSVSSIGLFSMSGTFRDWKYIGTYEDNNIEWIEAQADKFENPKSVMKNVTTGILWWKKIELKKFWVDGRYFYKCRQKFYLILNEDFSLIINGEIVKCQN